MTARKKELHNPTKMESSTVRLLCCGMVHIIILALIGSITYVWQALNHRLVDLDTVHLDLYHRRTPVAALTVSPMPHSISSLPVSPSVGYIKYLRGGFLGQFTGPITLRPGPSLQSDRAGSFCFSDTEWGGNLLQGSQKMRLEIN